MLCCRRFPLWTLAGLLVLAGAARADDRPLRQIIDEHVQAAWQREQVRPAGLAADATFLRRVYLDLVGVIPSYAETVAFLQDTSADKRARLIDKLLDDPRFAAQQASFWDQVLFGRDPPDPELTRRRDLFQKWLTDQFAANVPYDRWVKELLLSEGSTAENGPVMFYAQFRNKPDETAVAVSKIFLGTQLQCARCHDHPFDKWKQTDFYGLAGFFARLAFLEGNVGGKRHYMVAEKSTGEVLFTGPAADQKPGQKGTPVAARYLGGDVLQEPPLPKDFREPELKGAKSLPKPFFSRKQMFADWATSPDNPYFTRAVVNRIWAQFLGRGLVHPVDNLGDNNPPSLPELMEAMAGQLRGHGYDLKWLIRELVNTQVYQQADTGELTDALLRWYERARVRPLTAEELMASIRTATGYDLASGKPGERLPGATNEYFLRYFGEPVNGRGDFQAGLAEHLFLNNSGDIRQMIAQKTGNLADQLLTDKAPWEEKVDRLFVWVLNRPPKPKERQRFVAHLTSQADARPLVEEAIWALINSSEFRFNH
jgi:hypothetical protein